MKELLEELKALIEVGKKEEAIAKVDEISRKIDEEQVEYPLPGEGSNGERPIK